MFVSKLGLKMTADCGRYHLPSPSFFLPKKLIPAFNAFPNDKKWRHYQMFCFQTFILIIPKTFHIMTHHLHSSTKPLPPLNKTLLPTYHTNVTTQETKYQSVFSPPLSPPLYVLFAQWPRNVHNIFLRELWQDVDWINLAQDQV